jgi:hypothetical protein
MTPAEFYTSRFYSWEYRGRGWHLCQSPAYLEAPFIPYVRIGYPKVATDDGKRHTLLSRIFGTDQPETKSRRTECNLLDYDSLAPYIYDEAIDLVALQIKVSKDRRIGPQMMKSLLVMLSDINAPLSFEIIGTNTEIIIQFVCNSQYVDSLEMYLHAYFPYYAVIRSNVYLANIMAEDLATAVVDYGLKHEFVRPLTCWNNFSIDPLIGVFGVLERLTEYQQAGIQIIFQPTINRWTESIIHSVTMHDGTSFFLDATDAPKLAQDKVKSPLYGVTIRTFGQAPLLTEAFHIHGKICNAMLQGTKGTFNELIPLATEAYDVHTRIADIYTRQSHRLGMLLNMDELISILHFPTENIQSRKLFTAIRKTKELPSIARDKEYILGTNIHNGVEEEVTFGIEERLKHTHIIGATGTGKSTLIANLILQDIEKGRGVVLFDPHGDLVDDIMIRVPLERVEEVILIDPSDIDYPIGLNILEAHSDIEKEVLSSDLVAIFRKYATSWGDQMNAIVANAILAILESKEGGSLHDLRRFLIEKDYRTKFLKTVTDPAVLYYWQKEYPILKTNSIGPILTRLNTFLRPRAIRNMVIQKKGLDFERLLNSNKIILLKLSQGLIGIENSFLLGSLILSKLHQAILQRQQTANRNPIFIYLDEFQNFITPSIKDMISGIRKYSVGLTLSHQDLQQLQREDGELSNSVLGNINTRIVFRVGEPDAKKLQDGFSGFDHTDLQNLGRGEAIVRIEQPQYDCSLDTIPLSDEVNEDYKELIMELSRLRYAADRETVEAELYESFDIDSKEKEPEGKKKPQPKTESQSTQEKPDKQETVKPPPVGLQHFEAEDIEFEEVVEREEVIEVTEPILPKPPVEEKDISTHRYLQTLIKKMAEARGYTATIEMLLPDGSGQVDVLLSKDGKSIAVEICITTDPEWEMHNIAKCIRAGYSEIVSLSGDIKQLEKIKKKCITGIAEFEKHRVLFFTPDALFSYLDETVKEHIPEEKIMKGYRINVTYDAISKEEMEQKRKSVSKVILDTMRKRGYYAP